MPYNDPENKRAWMRRWRKSHPIEHATDNYKRERSVRGRIIRALNNAKARCENPAHKFYGAYGGRGIKYLLTEKRLETILLLSPEYKRLISLGIKPSLDRIDNNGHYVLDNIQVLPMATNAGKRH